MYEYFSLRINKDRMKAYLTVLYDNLNETVTVENILDYLKKKGIVFGIQEEEIKKAVDNKYLISNLLVAIGDGLSINSDENIDYVIDVESSVIPQTNSNGFIDFEKLKEPAYVHKGDLICSINIPVDKLECTDIFGKKFVLSEDGFLPDFGSGVEYRQEEHKVYAVLDGCVNYEEHCINVMPAHIIKENIGNGNYVGNVIIYAKIEDGMNIRSDENIIIYGSVGNAYIEAGKSIVVHGDIRDSGKCTIKAKKNIICQSISNVNLYCGGSIYSNQLEKCVAKAGKSILVDGVGLIHSGRYTAGEMVVAKTLKNSSSNDLMINLWDGWYDIENNTGEDKQLQLFRCEEELSELRNQYIKLGTSLDTLKNMDYIEGNNANRANIIRRITLVRAQVMNSILAKKKLHEKIQSEIYDKKMEIACSGEIYRGVQFRIGQAGYTVPDNTSNRVFYINDKDVFIYRQYK